MAEGAHATLDNPLLRARLRRDFSQPSYIRRPVARPHTTLLSDVSIPRRPASSLGATNSVAPTYLVAPPRAPINASPTTQQKPEPAIQPQAKAKRSKLQLALVGLAIVMVLGGGYLSLLGFHANHIAQAQAATLTAQANAVSKGGAKSTAPSTVKPTAAAVTNYTVAPNLPKYLMIPKLGVDARILSVGVTATGALGTPDNVYDTAWYNESAEPGQPGAMLIDGHVSSWTTHGVFYGIKSLVAGDLIKVERGDGTVFTYSVVSSQVYSSGNVNMAAAMTPIVAGKAGLNLITCTGDVIPGTSEFNERMVVFAEQVS